MSSIGVCHHRSEMARILVGTRDGLHELDPGGGRGAVWHAGRRVTAVAPEGWELWAVLDGHEVWHTAGVEWWFRVAHLGGRRANCMADTRAGVVVGTSEGGLLRVAGEGLEPIRGFEQVEGRAGWYTPWGGPPDTRSVSEDRDAVYVNVHVGGILRSRDHGDTWRPTIDLHTDVHRVLARPGRLLAACAQGLAVSYDGGDTWRLRSDGLHAAYCRSVAVCGDVLLLSAADGASGGRGAVYRGGLDGESLERCRAGLPEWFEDNVDSLCLDAVPNAGLAAFGTSDGRVFASLDQGATWDEVAAGLPPVECLLAQS
jgi:hypothetical protein